MRKEVSPGPGRRVEAWWQQGEEMPVQVQTLSLLGAMQALVVALMLWLGVRSDRSRAVRSLHLRAAALAVEALGYVSLTLGSVLPMGVVTLGGNAMNLLAQAMSVIALRMLLAVPLRWRLVTVVNAVGWLGVAWFAAVVPDYLSRVAWGSAAIACNLLLNIEALLLAKRGGHSRARLVLLWIFIASLALLVWRLAMMWLGSGHLPDVFVPDPTNIMFVLLSGMQPLLYGLGFLLLYNEILQRELYRLARIDVLTGVPNRLALEERFAALQARDGDRRVPFCVMLLDVDHFKRVNDRYGHACGDKALKALVASVGTVLRRHDVIGRLGGEEFIVLGRGIGQFDAELLAERIRAAVEAAPLVVDGHTVQLTVSVGVAVAAAHERDLETVLRRADEAMYAAKRAGRNQVVTAAIGAPVRSTDA